MAAEQRRDLSKETDRDDETHTARLGDNKLAEFIQQVSVVPGRQSACLVRTLSICQEARKVSSFSSLLPTTAASFVSTEVVVVVFANHDDDDHNDKFTLFTVHWESLMIFHPCQVEWLV